MSKLPDPFRVALDQALAMAGVASVTQWTERHPGKHLWVALPAPPDSSFVTMLVCGPCGVIQRADGNNKPCGGIVPVMPRIDQAAKQTLKKTMIRRRRR